MIDRGRVAFLLFWIIIRLAIAAQLNDIGNNSDQEHLFSRSRDQEKTWQDFMKVDNNDYVWKSTPCNWTQNSTDVIFNCSHSGLTYFNINWIWPNTTVLDISYNDFTSSVNFTETQLDSLRVLRVSHNHQLLEILDNPFVGMKNLEYLDMSYNNLNAVSEQAFVGLNHLETLDLSNPVTNFDLPDAALKPLKNLKTFRINRWKLNNVKSLRLFQLCSLNHSSVTTLDLQGVNRGGAFGVFWNLVPPLFYCFGKTRIKHLHMSKNQIITLHSGVLRYMRYLSTLNFSDNLIIGGDFAILVDFALMFNLTKIDLARQNYVSIHFGKHRYLPGANDIRKYNKLSSNLSRKENRKRIWIKIPWGLKVIEGGHSRFVVGTYNADIVLVNAHNSLEYLNLENTMLEQTYEGKLGYFPKLWYLNLQNSGIWVTNPAVFQNLTSLKYLLLGGCNLDYNLPNDLAWQAFIENTKLEQLRSLDMANNYLRYIPQNAFENFPSIVHLNLSYNRLEIVNFTISHLSDLQYLNLRNNSFSSLSDLNLQNMHKFINKSQLYIDVTGNHFICPCSDIPTLEFVRHLGIHFHGFRCEFSENKWVIDLDTINVTELLYYCGVDWFTTHWGTVYVGYVFIISCMVLCSSSYRNRRRIMYVWYLTQFKTKNNTARRPPDHFLFDGFVDYHSQDLLFIQELISHLENKYQYTLCLEDRNFGPGVTVTQNIAEACRYSVSMVILLSRKNLKGAELKSTLHFIKDQHNQRKAKVILIFLERPSRLFRRVQIPPTLEYLLSCNTHLIWPQKPEQSALFWMKLRHALGCPMKTQGQVDPLTLRQTVLYYHGNTR